VKKRKPSFQRGHKLEVLRQICNWIPDFLVSRLARETGVAEKARTFSPWSHVVAMIYAQLTHAISLNDVCDALRLFSGPLSAIRGAVAPSTNAFSHANKVRDAKMAERLLWAVLDHLQNLHPKFASGKRRLPRFKRCIQAVDGTVITLVANCMSWAKHRRRKAATKLHVRLDLQSFLPRFALVDLAPHHDSTRAAEMCAGLKEGEIAVFDKAFVVFSHLYALTQRGVYWVTRAKENLDCRVCQRRAVEAKSNILRDEIIELRGVKTSAHYPEQLRRVTVKVNLDGQEVQMTFLTNNLDWSGQSVADLYRCRWDIEKFFKQIKQSLQLCDFLGNNANAVHWQIWIALLVYVLLRFLAFLSNWPHSFTRLWALARSALWRKIDFCHWLRSYGTARGHFHFLSRPEQAYFPNWGRSDCGIA
jgi:hypothetical protein